MSKEIKDSKYLEEAFEILESIKGSFLTLEERKNKSSKLAALILKESQANVPFKKHHDQKRNVNLLKTIKEKAFILNLTDICFRTKNNKTTAHNILNIIYQFDIPKNIRLTSKILLHLFKLFGLNLPSLFVPIIKRKLIKEFSHTILSGTPDVINKHILKRKEEGFHLILYHITENILGEEFSNEVIRRYLNDLLNPNIDNISINLPVLFSQYHLINHSYVIEKTKEKLRLIFRAAIKNKINDTPKFVTLEINFHKELEIALQVFKQVLDEPEFHNLSAGIILSSYFPENYENLKDLISWAKTRIVNGGSPITIYITKGAFLGAEQVDASCNNWNLPIFPSKNYTDANFKKMLNLALNLENTRAAHIRICSHNIFDLSYALLLRSETQTSAYVDFAMLEGRMLSLRNIIKKLSNRSLFLYSPIATKYEFQNTLAYIIRRFDEFRSSDNIARHFLEMSPDNVFWYESESLFFESCDLIAKLSSFPQIVQDRTNVNYKQHLSYAFENEPNTDFSLENNKKWARDIINDWQNKSFESIPLQVNGKLIHEEKKEKGKDPSKPNAIPYEFSLASADNIKTAIDTAKKQFPKWEKMSFEEKDTIIENIAQNYREKRKDLIGTLITDTGKIIFESDKEVSEAIDLIEYYRIRYKKMISMQDIKCSPKGVCVVIGSRGFPLSMSTGNIIGALLTGNTVIFRPTLTTVLVGWLLVNLMWEAGVSKNALQFLPTSEEDVEKYIVPNKTIDILTISGRYSTAQKFKNINPFFSLNAACEGKNHIIITSSADRNLAIIDLIHSAFDQSGQKASSVHLAVLEAEVYDDPNFRKQLKDAVKSLKVSSSWDLTTQIGPLVKPLDNKQLYLFSALEKDEEWLLKPIQDKENPNLWSPGIKLGIKNDSLFHRTPLFGPLLGLARANDFKEAIEIANNTEYNLTQGLQSLNIQEHYDWLKFVKAGNYFINHKITGPFLRRQPFGGYNKSILGAGYKVGGPNYLLNFVYFKQISPPKEKYPIDEITNHLTPLLEEIDLSTEQLGMWYASVANYAYWHHNFSKQRDPSKIIGQDNFLKYVPYDNIIIRITEDSNPFDILRACAALLSCKIPLKISIPKEMLSKMSWIEELPTASITKESEQQLISRITPEKFERIRMTTRPSEQLVKACAKNNCYIIDSPVLANGRIELIKYLREVTITYDYHRYGNLGIREGELRRQNK